LVHINNIDFVIEVSTVVGVKILYWKDINYILHLPSYLVTMKLLLQGLSKQTMTKIS